MKRRGNSRERTSHNAAGASSQSSGLTRRDFLRAGAIGAGAMLAGPVLGRSLLAGQPATAATGAGAAGRPNILFISTDQQGMDTLSAYGCPDVRTPNIDRIVKRGVSFTQSYTTNPLCSPARSTWFTGRMPCETGVVQNSLHFRDGMPTMGEMLSAAGYETFYSGKWHIPVTYGGPIPGFNVIPAGFSGGHGFLADTAVSHSCQSLLQNRRSKQPFALVASLLQPHDICYWVQTARKFPIKELPYGLREDQLPPLPPSFEFNFKEPETVRKCDTIHPDWTPLQWRYYLWSYYRGLEMADAEVGRILDALENSPFADNTIVLFTSDHGEGRARHKTVTKNFLYEQAVRVPMAVCWPGQIGQDVRDEKHLVSGTDILPTFCDYAGIAAPANIVGRSLRPLLEGRSVAWRDSVGVEATVTGRMLRTEQYKYITYENDPVEQLFDLKADPWETKNLAESSDFASTLEDHRKQLKQWDSQLDKAPRPTTGPATIG